MLTVIIVLGVLVTIACIIGCARTDERDAQAVRIKELQNRIKILEDVIATSGNPKGGEYLGGV